MDKNRIEEALGELDESLRVNLLDTKKITVSDWNKHVAPRLSELGMAIQDVKITARTYRLPENYFD